MPIQSTSQDSSLRSSSADSSFRSTSVPGDPIGPFVGAIASDMRPEWSASLAGAEAFAGPIASDLARSLSVQLLGAEGYSGSIASDMLPAWSAALAGAEAFVCAIASDMRPEWSASLAGAETFAGPIASDMATAWSASVTATNFIPTQVASLKAWYRADLGITFGTGSAVAAWADQSGSGDSNKNATQATATKRPTQNTNDAAYGHRDSLSFASASAQDLVTGAWASALSQPYTVLFVGSVATSAAMYFLDGNQASHLCQTHPSNNTTLNVATTTNLVATVTSMANPSVLGILMNGTSSKIFQNNHSTPVASGTTGTAQTLTGMTLGASSAGTSPLNGKLAEVIVCSGDITGSSDFANLFTYLGKQYGIATT